MKPVQSVAMPTAHVAARTSRKSECDGVQIVFSRNNYYLLSVVNEWCIIDDARRGTASTVRHLFTETELAALGPRQGRRAARENEDAQQEWK